MNNFHLMYVKVKVFFFLSSTFRNQKSDKHTHFTEVQAVLAPVTVLIMLLYHFVHDVTHLEIMALPVTSAMNRGNRKTNSKVKKSILGDFLWFITYLNCDFPEFCTEQKTDINSQRLTGTVVFGHLIFLKINELKILFVNNFCRTV